MVEKFSFGSVCIDGVTYDYDVVIEHGKSANARRRRPKNCATSSAIHRSPLPRTYRGAAAALWWERAPAERCLSWTMSGMRPAGVVLNSS